MHSSRRRWGQHAVKPGAAEEDAGANATLRFSAQHCTKQPVPGAGVIATRPSLRKRQRNEQKKQSQRPHDRRTRTAPFEGDWEQVTAWLPANPERTRVSLFQELHQRYPDR